MTTNASQTPSITNHDGRPLCDYPVGTKAFALMGGHWCKITTGWKWNGPGGTGGTFPNPGGDWDQRILLPDPQNQASATDPIPKTENPPTVTRAQRAMEAIASIVRERFPRAAISWVPGKYGLELKVGGAKFPRVGRVFVQELAENVAWIRHKWPGRGEFYFNQPADWVDFVRRHGL